MISPDIIEEVRRRADPVLLIGSRVKLWKSGVSYAGSCPFHEERHASFRLYPKDKRFVCFGCGAGARAVSTAGSSTTRRTCSTSRRTVSTASTSPSSSTARTRGGR